MFVRTSGVGHSCARRQQVGCALAKLSGMGVAIVVSCCGLALASAGSGLAASQTSTYTATESIAVPPASNFSGQGGGDGWAVALSSTQVFNVFHHSSVLTVACHNQSDASACWSPETITDSSHNNFATSGHPGMYLDQNTGKLYVYATRSVDATAGVVCVDTTQAATNPNPFCGFTALTPVGDGPLDSGISGTSQPVQFGNRLYAFNYVNASSTGAQNKMLCFDVSTDAACAGQPFSVNVGAGAVSVAYPSPVIALIGNQVVVPIVVGGADELACMNANTEGNCAGAWPVAVGSGYVGSNGPPFPMLDGHGNLSGLCLPTGTDQCYTLAGAGATTPSGMTGVINASDPWNGPAFAIGPRVYVPNGNAGGDIGEVECYDSSTNAACTGFPKTFTNLGYLYTVNPDPQRPTCIWVNADNGSAQIQNFDAFTGGPCGEGPIRALASQFVVPQQQCTPNTYVSLEIVSPARTAYTSGSLSFEDGDGNPIPGASDRPIDSHGAVDLTGLNLNTATGLPQFLITLNGASGTTKSVVVTLTWTAAYDPTCISGNVSATPPAVTAAASNVSATEGKPFAATVATFADPDAGARTGDHVASINWGDGTTSTGAITGSPAKFTISGNHTYGEEGTFPIKVTIGDGPRSKGATVSSNGKVADAALHATAAHPNHKGKSVSGKVATFTDDDPKGALSDYTASINWGDGHASSGSITDAPATFSVAGGHVYSKNGTFKVTVRIKDKGGSSATATLSVTVGTKAVVHGAATVKGTPRACVLMPIQMQVRGRQIASVKWSLDGHRITGKTVHKGNQYAAQISISPGQHTVAVKVTFKTSSHTRARTFHRTVSGCPLVSPKFTG